MKEKRTYLTPVSLLLSVGNVGGNVGSGNDGAEWQSKQYDMDMDEDFSNSKWSTDFSED